MSKMLWCFVVLIEAALAVAAGAAEGGRSENTQPPAVASDAVPADNEPELPPWQRPGADEPEDGVDDDPTTFDPGAGPTAPDPG